MLSCHGLYEQMLSSLQNKTKHSNIKYKLFVFNTVNSFASNSYIKGLKVECLNLNVDMEVISEFTGDNLSLISGLNRVINTPNAGFIILTPVDKNLNPKSFNLVPLINQIDIDGFFDNSKFEKCTPQAIMRILEDKNILLSGKNVVIIGRSNVGKPLIDLLLKKDTTVTICHRQTTNLESHLKNADIIISTAGFPGLITSEMISDSSLIIDVGVNQRADGCWVGDVSDDCELVNPNIIGIKSGIGKITRLILMENLFQI